MDDSKNELFDLAERYYQLVSCIFAWIYPYLLQRRIGYIGYKTRNSLFITIPFVRKSSI